eukprot:6075904-Prymnesium_polylepis.1
MSDCRNIVVGLSGCCRIVVGLLASRCTHLIITSARTYNKVPGQEAMARCPVRKRKTPAQSLDCRPNPRRRASSSRQTTSHN